MRTLGEEAKASSAGLLILSSTIAAPTAITTITMHADRNAFMAVLQPLGDSLSTDVSLLRRCGVRLSLRLTGSGPRLLLFQPEAVMLPGPVHVDLADAHRLEGALHADRADVDVGEHGGDKQHRHGAVNDLGPLHSRHVGGVEREHQEIAGHRH